MEINSLKSRWLSNATPDMAEEKPGLEFEEPAPDFQDDVGELDSGQIEFEQLQEGDDSSPAEIARAGIDEDTADIEISFDESALDYIVDKALEFKLGARGLRSICEAIMLDAMFELPSEEENKKGKVVIDEAYAKQKLDKSTLSQLKVAS